MGFPRYRNIRCQYCNQKAQPVHGSELYAEKNPLSKNMFYACLGCDAWVGMHKHSRKPFGSLANKELRNKRVVAHTLLDPLWARLIEQFKLPKPQARTLIYTWLSQKMGIPFEDCHIGMFDVEQCNMAMHHTRKLKDADLSFLLNIDSAVNPTKANVGGVS
ncbi:zinc-finger-containing protein [Acinetobacter sp. P1(2025)]|uniref:zinc-finger-containing protein n=1 Tax=Acinetobacter sp. P1(2025) TaxID=3446120 RepID=UPI003F5309E1